MGKLGYLAVGFAAGAVVALGVAGLSGCFDRSYSSNLGDDDSPEQEDSLESDEGEAESEVRVSRSAATADEAFESAAAKVAKLMKF
ncbi:MAG: hypothetical protein LBR11_02420 [Deltaproteobacteria bacterium]|jgi:hypothetical protein|nr:hypothetical protein [Deltaproteobacteria bacterium]